MRRRKSRFPTLVKSFKNRRLLLALLVVLAALAALLITYRSHNDNSYNTGGLYNSGNSNNQNDSAQKTPPVSDSSNQPADTAKDIGGTSSGTSGSTGPSNKSDVTPIITVAGQNQTSGQINVRAYIPGIFESTGTCTATFSLSGYNSVSKSSPGFQNVSYTTCTPINVSRSAFPVAGNWTLTVSYKSPAYKGTSAAQTVTIE